MRTLWLPLLILSALLAASIPLNMNQGPRHSHFCARFNRRHGLVYSSSLVYASASCSHRHVIRTVIQHVAPSEDRSSVLSVICSVFSFVCSEGTWATLVCSFLLRYFERSSMGHIMGTCCTSTKPLFTVALLAIATHLVYRDELRKSKQPPFGRTCQFAHILWVCMSPYRVTLVVDLDETAGAS